MEFVINQEYANGNVAFKNAELKKATNAIFANMNTSKIAFCKAAVELERIHNSKLFEKDFFSPDGKPSFSAYCEIVLGISRTKAYRIIKTAKMLLYPEFFAKEKQAAYFQNFGDTNLSIIAEGAADYEDAKKMCVEMEIDEISTQKDVRAAVKKWKKLRRGEIFEYSEDVSAETEEEETTDNTPLTALVKQMFEEDINAIIELFPNYVDVIKRVVKEW